MMRVIALALMLIIVYPSVSESNNEPLRSEALIERMLKREAIQRSLAPLTAKRPNEGRERDRLNRFLIQRYRRELHREYLKRHKRIK